MTDLIRDVAYGNGIYVFVGDGGAIYTSTDLVSFTKRTSGTTFDLQKYYSIMECLLL